MRFETPWETTVVLPGGLVADGERCLRRVSLRPLTGREEDWLADSRDVPSAVKVTRLLTDCVISIDQVPASASLIRQLLAGDRDFIMLRLRAATLGDRVRAVMVCPECSSRMDVEFSIAAVPVETMPQSASSYAMQLNGRTIQFRLPSGEDQEAVLGMPLPEAAAKLLDRCVLENGGRAVEGVERDAVAAEMERLAPRVELELDLICPECAHEFVAPFDTTAFFFEEMKINHQHLLREFHALAFYYHWNEPDILSLRRDRRRAYLGLLNDTLRRD